jgi:hypothetical protein
MKSDVKIMLIVFFDMKGTVHKDFALADYKSILYTAEALYGDCMRMCEDFALNFGNKRAGCYIITTCYLTLHFHQGIFYQKTT